MLKRLANIEGPPESVRLEAGETFLGTIVGYSSAETAFGPCVIAYVEEEKSGELQSLWLLHRVLRNEFAKQKPRIGDTVGLKYHGTQSPKSGDGQDYHSWSLLVEGKGREEALPDFELSNVED